jgi:hypothetical protein
VLPAFETVTGVTAKVLAGPTQPFELVAVTDTLPEVVPLVTLIDVVPAPEFITHPLGTVQL